MKNITLQVGEILKQRWDDLCQKLNISDAGTFLNDIITNYSEPGRAYHNLNHINNCLEDLGSVKTLLENPQAVEVAVWYHDIIYVIGRSDNEEESAKIAANFCQTMNLSSVFTKQVEDCILATKHISSGSSLDSRYMADFDMAILGQPVDIFDEYEEQISREYQTVYSAADYRKGRIDFLKKLLDHPIYQTELFRNKYEVSARSNLQRTIDKLQNSV